MKRLLSILLTTALAASALSGCGAKKSDDHLARIKEAGKITIATEGVWAPFTYHDPSTDELVGFDVEVAAAIAEKLGVTPEFKEVAFDGGLTGVSTGTFDMMANGVDVTDERSETYDFTDAYAYDFAYIMYDAAKEIKKNKLIFILSIIGLSLTLFFVLIVIIYYITK